MTTRIRRLAAAAAFSLALTSVPTTGLAYPLTSSTSSQSGANPLRILLAAMSNEADALWSAVNGAYSDSYVSTSGCTVLC